MKKTSNFQDLFSKQRFQQELAEEINKDLKNGKNGKNNRS
jgi:hypothetical protein